MDKKGEWTWEQMMWIAIVIVILLVFFMFYKNAGKFFGSVG